MNTRLLLIFGCNAYLYTIVKNRRVSERNYRKRYVVLQPRAPTRSLELADGDLPRVCRRSPTVYLQQGRRSYSGRGSNEHGLSQGPALAQGGSEPRKRAWLALRDGSYNHRRSLAGAESVRDAFAERLGGAAAG